MITIEEGLKRIQTKYPQAHIIQHGTCEPLLIVPGILLPKGWNKTICTVLTKIPYGYPGVAPYHFWVDLPDLQLQPEQFEQYVDWWGDTVKYPVWTPRSTNNNNIYGYPEWDGCVKWFAWALQAWNPNNDSLFTWLSTITKNRLARSR